MKRAALLAVAIGLVGAPVAFGGGQASTRVTMDNIEVSPSGTIYTGDIFSPRRVCKNERRVMVYRVRAGDDQLRAETRSYEGPDVPGFYWVAAEDGIPPDGNYYAKVRATNRCEGDRSPLYQFNGAG